MATAILPHFQPKVHFIAILGSVWYRVGILDPYFMDDMNDGSTQGSAKQAEVVPPGRGASNDRLMAALGYVGALCLIPLIFARQSPFAQEHAKQGLVLSLIAIVVKVFAPGLWHIPFGGLLVMVAGFAIFITAIMGLVKALQGEKFEIPYISDWARKIHF